MDRSVALLLAGDDSVEVIVALGHDVEIIVRPTRGGDAGRVLVLEAG